MGRFLPRQSIYNPIGLVTQPNKYGQYPSGACKVAQNMLLRNPGELVQAPDVQQLLTPGSNTQTIYKVIPDENPDASGGGIHTLQAAGSSWAVYINGALGVLFGSATDAFSNTGRISSARVADRIIVNGNFGCLVRDPTPIAYSYRDAGFHQVSVVGIGAVDDGDGWFPGGSMVAYVACAVRRYSDDYTLRSAPSTPLKHWLSAADPGPWTLSVDIRWNNAQTIFAGDIIELYRTDILTTGSGDTDPGATFKLVYEHVVTSGEAAAASVQIEDVQRPIFASNQTPGRELYTNPGQDGPDYANYRPPIAKCIASFKGFAFYGNTTEPAQLVFSVPAGLGHVDEAEDAGVAEVVFREKGIGERSGSGTRTSGSPTVTGISAAEMVGIKVGQQTLFGVPAIATVIAVGASSFTLDVNYNSSGSTWELSDMLEINGVPYRIESGRIFVAVLAGTYQIECDVAIPYRSISSFQREFMQAFEFTIQASKYPLDTPMTVRATNGANYSPPLPEITAAVKTIQPIVKKNRLAWAKEQQPEHCPGVNETFVGFGDLLGMNATRDALWIWCTDGLFRLSGNAGAFGFGQWQVDYANSSLILAAPQASSVMNEMLYGQTNIGFVEIDSAGQVVNLTDKVIGDLIQGLRYVQTCELIVECNERTGEVLVALGEQAVGSSTVYVFNARTRGWTTLGSNGTNLSNITAIAMQRFPSSSGQARILFAVRPVASVAPVVSGWDHPTNYLAGEVQYQPIYGDDPLELKDWLWADYVFDASSAGKQFDPTWNGTKFGGTVTAEGFDQGSYARAGCPREVAKSLSVSPGLRAIAAGTTQARFQGLSVPLKKRTNAGKKR